MIHDATGKFSSRWVFPDRSSLALVIGNWLHSSWRGTCAGIQAHAGDRVPHIGEYAAKTNAIWAHQRMRPVAGDHAGNGPRTTGRREGDLLPVVFQNLIASRGDLGAILLQAGQNGEITLIDYRTAEALHVAVAGLLLFRRSAALLLGDGTR
jgi:hypothetical protein